MSDTNAPATSRWRRRLCAVALVGFALIALSGAPNALAQTGGASITTAAPSEPSLKQETAALSKHTEKLSDELHETRTFGALLLSPIAILVAILSAGGVLSVVFSVRDQGRISQLHELTVAGEVSSQRRSEQSYGSFLEQSQTTLALVNDTLKLAKEATDRAAHSMDIKAQARLDAIEDRAEKLMLDVFSEAEFELILIDTRRRGELHAVADELRSLEGYLSLQDIKLPDYTKFVKAIDQFLLDDTESALQALRLASQDRVAGDLQRFIEYWLGYMLTTIGAYDEAVGMFRHDENDLKKDDAEYFQLERIIAETEFFQLAKQNTQERSPGSSKSGRLAPQQRFKMVAPLLDRLAKLATHVGESGDHRAQRDTRLEVARTRADIYEWVAYDPRHLDEPLSKRAIRRATAVAGRKVEIVKAKSFAASRQWSRVGDADTFRAWALLQAQAICERETDRNFDVEFALAECYFKLRNGRAESAFEKAEHTLHDLFGEFREKRRNASLQQSLLISHSRLLKLRGKDPQQRRAETRLVGQAARHAQEAVNEMRQGHVTVFSQVASAIKKAAGPGVERLAQQDKPFRLGSQIPVASSTCRG
jgi:tetratricopeptide (TPR) repeat protein